MADCCCRVSLSPACCFLRAHSKTCRSCSLPIALDRFSQSVVKTRATREKAIRSSAKLGRGLAAKDPDRSVGSLNLTGASLDCLNGGYQFTRCFDHFAGTHQALLPWPSRVFSHTAMLSLFGTSAIGRQRANGFWPAAFFRGDFFGRLRLSRNERGRPEAEPNKNPADPIKIRPMKPPRESCHCQKPRAAIDHNTAENQRLRRVADAHQLRRPSAIFHSAKPQHMAVRASPISRPAVASGTRRAKFG